MIATTVASRPWPKAFVALALACLMMFVALVPASAETAGQRSTRNIILGAAAVTLGVILYNNYVHKTRTHNTVVGHTADGGTVYADGRIVYPDGTVVYTSNDGRHRCSYDGYRALCGSRARGYAWRYDDEDSWHGEGLKRGWYKGRHNPHHDNDDSQGNER